MLIGLSDVSCYLEGEMSREKEIKNLLQPLASIFVIDLCYWSQEAAKYYFPLWEVPEV